MRAILPPDDVMVLGPELPRETLRVVDAGWTVGPSGALLLTALWGNGWRQEIGATEVGRYEYDVNDVHIPLSDLAADMSTYLTKAAKRGIVFATQMLRAASSLPGSAGLCAAISVFVDTEHEDFSLQGAAVRFFTHRGAYPDWFDDLEGFELHAIAVLEMAEAAPS